MSFSDHASRLAGRCYYYLRQIRGVRRSLTVDSCHALVRALILSRLDYCNGLLSGTTGLLLSLSWDGVLRSAARVVLQLPRRSGITSAIHDRLHCLDVSSRILFKLCVLARRCLDGSAPLYLRRFITPVSLLQSRAHLRSSASGDIVVPRFACSTFGLRAFAASAPRVWNTLPSSLKSGDCSISTFRNKLKTFLFAQMVNDAH